MASKPDKNAVPLRVSIRRMLESDLEDVYPIELASYTSPWPLECFEGELRINTMARYVVAETEKQEVVGYAGQWIAADEAHITTLAVRPDRRRRKVAEQLLVHQLEGALRERVESIYLEVRRHNPAAQMLYSRYRFVPVRVRERYYSDNQEDAIELRVPDARDEKFLENLLFRRRELMEKLRNP